MKKGHAVAKVTFTANRDLVGQALAAGWSAKAIYEQNQAKLVGISYRQFLRYANEMRADAAAKPPRAAAAQDSAASPSKGQPNAGHKSPTGTFIHHPEIRQDDKERLIGTPVRPDRK